MVTFFNSASSKLSKSTTICKLPKQEPSFRAINRLLLNALTHPLTNTSSPGLLAKAAFTLILAIISN